MHVKRNYLKVKVVCEAGEWNEGRRRKGEGSKKAEGEEGERERM